MGGGRKVGVVGVVTGGGSCHTMGTAMATHCSLGWGGEQAVPSLLSLPPLPESTRTIGPH